MATTILIIFLCAFIAFSLSAICGGGAGLLMMPVLGLVLPVTQVPAALSMGTVSSSVSRIAVFFTKINWQIVRWFVPTAVPAVFLGAWLLHFFNPLYLEIIMGIFLVSNLSQLTGKKNKQQPEHAASHAILLIIGFLAGFLSGLTGAVGLLFNKFYLRYGLSKEEIVATRAANELILHIIKLALYASFGLIVTKVVVIGLTVAVAGILSSWFMKWGLTKISETFFRRIGYASMVISGVLMLTQATSGLASQKHANISFLPVSNGLESKLQWQRANFAIEFEYDEGFEFEQQIPMAELPEDKRAKVYAEQDGADHIIIEEVFGIGAHSYEAYYFKNKVLVKKIESI